jgi:hypothetical protein
VCLFVFMSVTYFSPLYVPLKTTSIRVREVVSEGSFVYLLVGEGKLDVEM